MLVGLCNATATERPEQRGIWPHGCRLRFITLILLRRSRTRSGHGPRIGAPRSSRSVFRCAVTATRMSQLDRLALERLSGTRMAPVIGTGSGASATPVGPLIRHITVPIRRGRHDRVGERAGVSLLDDGPRLADHTRRLHGSRRHCGEDLSPIRRFLSFARSRSFCASSSHWFSPPALTPHRRRS
jgi:hypothetical protein